MLQIFEDYSYFRKFSHVKGPQIQKIFVYEKKFMDFKNMFVFSNFILEFCKMFLFRKLFTEPKRYSVLKK